MSSISRTKTISLLCFALLLFFAAGSGTAFAQGNSTMLSNDDIRLHMADDVTLDEILQSVLGSSERVQGMQGQAVAEALSFSSVSGKDEIKRMDDYTRYTMYNPTTAFIGVPDIQEYIPDVETDQYAMLYRVRPSASSEGYQFMIEIAGARFEINISDRLHHDFIARIGDNQITLIGETEQTLEFRSDQWYNVLITFGQEYTYQYLMWQDSNPSAYMYQNYDLSPYFNEEDHPFANHVMAEMTFSSNQQEAWMDVESVLFYRYDGIAKQSPADGCEDVINSVLNAPETVAVLRDEQLLHCARLQTANQSLNKTLTNEGDYIRACISSSQTGTARGIAGDWYFDYLRDYIEGTGVAEDRSINAVLLKFRYTGDSIGLGMFHENRYTTVIADINSSGVLNLFEMGNVMNDLENRGNAGAFQWIENEWYYALLAMDDTEYCFIAWQESNADNKTSYACGVCDADPTKQERYIWAGLHLRAQADALCLDIASITLYSFTDIADILPVSQPAAPQREEPNGDESSQYAPEPAPNGGNHTESSAAEGNAGKEVITFIPQTVQPIEAKPFMLPIETKAFSEFRQLTVTKPQMDDTASIENIASELLLASREVVTLQNEDLVNCIEFQTEDWSLSKTLANENGYVRALIQTGNDGQDKAKDIWGKLYFNGLRTAVQQAGGIREGKTSAVSVKFRYTGINSGLNLFLENQWVSVYAGLGSDGSLGVYANKEGIAYNIGNLGDEGVAPIQMMENEWYEMLLAIDGYYGCGFLIWQEGNPANNAFYTCDMSETYQSVTAGQEQYFWAGVNLWTHTNEAAFDIQSVSVYEFQDFTGADTQNRAVSQRYTYSGDDEKYRLAVRFFNDGDYYNAYLLLKELNGYDTSQTYLDECERLLQTVPLHGWALANGVVRSMTNGETPLSLYLYAYQTEQLETLDLSNWEVIDLNFLRHFPNLKELILDGNGITDLTPLKDLYALERLSLVENGIVDITPLSALTNLQYLNLSDNAIEDVTCLGNLSHLKELDLSLNNIHSLAGLYPLTELEMVDMSFNFISSVNALGNSKLRELNIVNTNINNLRAVAAMDTLEVLKAGYYYKRVDDADTYMLDKKYRSDPTVVHILSGMEAISGLTNLRTLYLGWLSTQTMQPLSQLPNLESLTLYAYSGPTDYEVLGGLTSLKEISLDGVGGGFDSLHFLLTLTGLETLEIGGGSTSGGAWPIASLVNLKKLALSGFDTDLSFLSGLDNLRELRLEQWDAVKDYSPITELESLEYLELFNTPILDFSLISQIKTLRCIKILNRRINSIEGIDQLTDLEYLYLGVARYSNHGNKKQLDQSLLGGLENLQYVFVCIGGNNGEDVAYGMGSEKGIQTLDLPSRSATKYWEYDERGINEIGDERQLEYPNTNPYLKIKFGSLDTSEPVKLTIPSNIRVLCITADSRKPIAIELDCVDNIALETVCIGHIDSYGADRDGAGSGNFVIENLDGLKGCINLKEIYINSAGITDISGLADCDKLEIVQLDNNKITDISPLADKQNLFTANLKGNKIENYEVLYSCIRLKNIDMNLRKSRMEILNRLPLFGK